MGIPDVDESEAVVDQAQGGPPPAKKAKTVGEDGEEVPGNAPAKRPRILRRNSSRRSRPPRKFTRSSASTSRLATTSARSSSNQTKDPLPVETKDPLPVKSTEPIPEKNTDSDNSNQWIPISLHSSVATSAIVPTSPDKTPGGEKPPSPCPESTIPSQLLTGSTFRFQNYFTTPIPLRQSPLPSLHWADSRELWTGMLKKEEKYVRDYGLLKRHSTLQSRMRSILLDWLIEVCEVYRLHRETFYLGVDFIDRYLSQSTNIHKQQLQLIGITALFIAAKLEEIYPPRLAEFAYVTDGACTEKEILEQELVMLKVLKWDLSPFTVNSWLNVYMQLVNIDSMEEKEQSFIVPQYSQHAFIQIARLLDLCFLDFGSLQFSYSVLATSAMYHITSEAVALAVSGYQWLDIAACVQWMAPFATTLREVGQEELKFFSQVASEDAHNIQTHSVDLALLERSQARQTQVETSSRASPDYTKNIPGIITPPQSKGKQRTCE